MGNNVHNVFRRENSLEKTVSLNELIGKRVLSKGGKIVGKVAEIRVNPLNFNLQGIVVGRDILRKPIYIGRSYFERLSHDSVILNVELSIFLKYKDVLDSKGKTIGQVRDIIRKGTTNEIESLIVRSTFSKKFIVPFRAIKAIGNNITLHSTYNVKKRYFWQRA